MADELEVLEKQQLSAQRSLHDLTDQLTLADHLVYKKYLTELQNYGMVELSQKMLEVQDPTQCIRMFQLKKLTLKKGEDMFQKLSTVYYSSMAQGCSLAVMIDVPEGNAGANIYLGVREDPLKQSMKSRKLEISSKALQKVLLSNFPGSDIKGISQKDEKELLDEAFGEAQEAVASVSCVAALRDKSKTEDKAFVQGIERFMDAMEGEKYTALFLAEPVSNETQAAIRSGYENLYSTLSPFRKSTWSYTENQSTAVMESLCSGTSHTISDTVSTTTTDGTNQSSSVTDGTQKTKGVSGGINGGVGSSFGTSVTKILAGGWRHCRHSGSGRLGSFGSDSRRRVRHRPAAWHGGQSRRRHGVSQNGFQQHCPEHRRLHGRKRLVGYQPLYHRADRHFAQHLRWNVAWNIGHHQPAGEPRHNGHPRHGPYSAGGTVQ
ncbi:MAG: VCBS domain-containing protein [Faecalibacterium prausnitzii]